MVRSALLVALTIGALAALHEGHSPAEPATPATGQPADNTGERSGFERSEFGSSPKAAEKAPRPAQERPERLIPEWVELWNPDERELTFVERMELNFVLVDILDKVAPFAWREYTRVSVLCTPVDVYYGSSDCPDGVTTVYTDGTIQVDIAPHTFTHGEKYMRNLVAHELAHVWQFVTGHDSGAFSAPQETQWYFITLDGRVTTREITMGGPSMEDLHGFPALELEADCLAAYWGHLPTHGGAYWDCTEHWALVAGSAYEANPLD